MGDIFCLADNGALIDHLYVSKSFDASGSTGQPGAKPHRIIKNATIFALGVALLEISYGEPLETFQTPDDLDPQGKRTMWTDYLIADRLVGDLHKRELPNFANATRRCVHCTFDSTVYSLDDDDFRERFYQGVIVPLKQDHDYVSS